MPINFENIQITGGVQLLSEANVPSPIILQLNFDGANGATTTTDSSEYANPVTLNAATISTSQSVEGGSSLNLTTQNSFYNVDNVQSLGTDDFTLQGWVRMSSTDSQQAQLFFLSYPSSTSANADTGLTLSFQVYAGPVYRFSFTYKKPDNTYGTWADTVNISLNTWYKWTLIRDAGTLKFYVGTTEKTTVPAITTDYTETTWRSSWVTPAGTGTNRRSLIGFQDQVQITKGLAIYPI
jgi:hypothetical protein